MAEQELSEQFDQFVEGIFAGATGHATSELRAEDPLAAVVDVATRLMSLPRESFRTRLLDDLKRRAAMSTSTATPATRKARPGFHTVTPYLAVREAKELIEFVKQAFGAEGASFGTGSEGGISQADYESAIRC